MTKAETSLAFIMFYGKTIIKGKVVFSVKVSANL